MLGLNKSSSKTIDIKLVEEKYYFPGQTIKGFVIVQPKNPTKTNHIILKFTGEVSLSLKERDAICLFQKSKVINVSPKDEQTKTVIMEPKLHSFPFEFVVPDDIQVPSTMEFNKKARIRYTLSALHDKPMVPESLCPKAEYPVHILEYIDTNDPKYRIPQDKTSKLFLPVSNPVNLCSIRVSLPRYGFTRGDIVPLSLIIHHFEPFTLPQAIDIHLIRTVEIRNNKNSQVKEDILKSTTCDIAINDASHFSQALKRQLLIPTSTPPSINFRNDMLRIQYKVRVCSQLTMPSSNQSQGEKKSCIVDIPIVVGTWPRASIPIDDDDYQDDATLEDTEFIDVTANSIYGSEANSTTSDDRYNGMNQFSQQQLDRLRGTPTTESSSGNSSASTVKLVAKSSPSSPSTHTAVSNNDAISRSDSLASKASSKSYSSYSSYRSSQSWETSSASLSRNTSLSTNVSLPDSSKITSAMDPSKAPSSSSETIIMTASPSCFNSPTSNNNNKHVSPFSQHRGSDPTGMATHPPIQQRHSFYDQGRRHQPQQQQYPVLVGPSPLKYQKHQSTILPSSNSTLHQHCRSSSSVSSSFYDQCALSSFSLASCTSMPESTPTSLLLSPISNDTILLQPVDTSHEKDGEQVNKKQQPNIETSAASSYDERIQHYSEMEQDDDDDDDDEDDDFLSIVRRKQEQTLLDERTRLHMAEMKI